MPGTNYVTAEAKIFLMQEEPTMKDCTVNNCAHHCQDSNYCGLTSIRVGTHETNPTEIKCTDCQSFELK